LAHGSIFHEGQGDAAYSPRRWKSLVATKESREFTQLAAAADIGGTDPAPEPTSAPARRDWSQAHVSVYSVPTLAPPRPHPTLRDLADNGQAHAIDFLAKSTDDAAKSWAYLQRALVDASEAEAGKDPLRFDRVLVATVSKGTSWGPGDRMVWTKILVRPENFRFAGYTVASTENETIKVTSVEATSSRKFSANIGLTLPEVEGPKADIGPGIERTVKRTADVNAQYEKLGIDITRDSMRIVRESETGGDAVGNTTVALSVLTDQDLIWTGARDDGRGGQNRDGELVLVVTEAHLYDGAVELDAAKATMTAFPQAQLPHCALLAKVWMLYEWREISDGREHYEESRHSVTLHREAEVQENVEIVPADDVSPAVWSIQILSPGPPGPSPLRFLRAHVGPQGVERELVFTDHSLASNFAHWARTHAGQEVQHMIFTNTEGESLQPVKVVGDQCAGNLSRAQATAVYRRPVGGP
jgi:hypothetical protein